MTIFKKHMYALLSILLFFSHTHSAASTPSGEIHNKYGITADGILVVDNTEYPFSHVPGPYFKFLRPLENPPGSGEISQVYVSEAGTYAKKVLIGSKDKNSRIILSDALKGSLIPPLQKPDYFLLQCVSNNKSFAKGLFRLTPQGESTFKAEGDLEALAIPIGAITSLMKVTAIYDSKRDRFSWDGNRSAETVPVLFESLSVSLAGGAGLIRFGGKSAPLSCGGSYIFTGEAGVAAAKKELDRVGTYGELMAEGSAQTTASNTPQTPVEETKAAVSRLPPKPQNRLRLSAAAPAAVKTTYNSDTSTDVDALGAANDAMIETEDGDYYEDMEVEVTISTLSGPSSYGNGILLRRDGDYGLMINMTGDGRVAIYEVTPTTYNWFALKPGADIAKTSFQAIKPGQPNRLKARIEGQVLTVEINGSPISSFAVGGPKAGRAGVFISAGNSVRFADYKITPLK